MTEKEMFIATREREFITTMRFLQQFPADQAEFTPAASKTKTAKELASVFFQELHVVDGVVKGQIDFMGMPKPPATYAEVLSSFKNAQMVVVPKVKAMSEVEWNSMITVPVGPKKIGQVRRTDMLWLMLMDSVHHRGQFSIYLRLVGAKVPSIYGPSGDEPWM